MLHKTRLENMIGLSRTSPAADAMREAHELELAEFYFRAGSSVASEVLERLKTLEANYDSGLDDLEFREFTKSFVDVLKEAMVEHTKK